MFKSKYKDSILLASQIMCNEDNPFMGKDIYLIGGGNSFKPEMVDLLPHDRVVCINSTYTFFPKCLALFWMDRGWYIKNYKKMAEREIQYTYYISKNKPQTAKRGYKWIYLHSYSHETTVKPPQLDDVSVTGNNTGCCAIDYLDKMKVNNIYLLGFDCKSIDGKSHSHDAYNFKLSDRTYTDVFLPCFESLSKKITHSKVYNCYAGSSIKAFRYKSLNSILKSEEGDTEQDRDSPKQ